MKRIEFKKLQKEIVNEGITLELIEKVQSSGKYSPAMLQKGDDPVTLVKCNNESFWVQLEDGSFLKEGKNLMKFDLKTCIIGRARYWTLFSDIETSMDNERKSQAKEKEILKEIERIKADVKKEAETVIEKYREVELYAGIKKGSIINDIIKSLNPERFELMEKNAIQFISDHPQIKEYVDSIEERLQSEDYDSLYISIKTNGLPLLLSIPNDNIGVLTQFFSKDKINDTLKLIEGQDHIQSVAMFNVNKRYL